MIAARWLKEAQAFPAVLWGWTDGEGSPSTASCCRPGWRKGFGLRGDQGRPGGGRHGHDDLREPCPRAATVGGPRRRPTPLRHLGAVSRGAGARGLLSAVRTNRQATL